MARPKPKPAAGLNLLREQRGYALTVRVHLKARKYDTAVQRLARALTRRTIASWEIVALVDCRKGFQRPVPAQFAGLRTNRPKKGESRP